MKKIPLILLLASLCAVCVAQQDGVEGRDQSTYGDVPLDRTSRTSLGVQVDHAFRVGAGDVVGVTVWDEPQLTTKALVRPDGYITVPLIGDVMATGLSPEQIQKSLADQFTRVVKHPRVSVMMEEIHSRVVYIAGEVLRPGAYPVSGQVDVLQLIALSGGVTKHAHKHKLFLLRQDNHRKIKVDYDRILKGQNIEQDVTLLPGDTVVVP